MRIGTTRDSMLHGHATELTCSVCGTKDLDQLIIQNIGIAAGISGDCYSFCHKCWNSKSLGKNILKLLGYTKLLIKEEMLDIKEVIE